MKNKIILRKRAREFENHKLEATVLEELALADNPKNLINQKA